MSGKNAIVTLGLAAAFAAPSFGSTVVAEVLSLNPSGSLTYILSGVEKTTLAGIFNWERSGGTDPFVPTNFKSVCIELTQNVAPNVDYTFDVVPVSAGPLPGSPESGGAVGMGPAKASQVKKLWAEYFDDALLSGANAAAFQTAVWEIVYDDGLDLAAGDFKAKTDGGGAFVNAHVNTAVEWLSNLANLTVEAPLVALTSRTEQDQVTVPEPAFGGLIGLGLLGMAARRRS